MLVPGERLVYYIMFVLGLVSSYRILIYNKHTMVQLYGVLDFTYMYCACFVTLDIHVHVLLFFHALLFIVLQVGIPASCISISKL